MNIAAILGSFVIFAIVIGFFGRKYRFGFWGYFFMSILLTPIVGILALIAAIPSRDARRARD